MLSAVIRQVHFPWPFACDGVWAPIPHRHAGQGRVCLVHDDVQVQGHAGRLDLDVAPPCPSSRHVVNVLFPHRVLLQKEPVVVRVLRHVRNHHLPHLGVAVLVPVQLVCQRAEEAVAVGAHVANLCTGEPGVRRVAGLLKEMGETIHARKPMDIKSLERLSW